MGIMLTILSIPLLFLVLAIVEVLMLEMFTEYDGLEKSYLTKIIRYIVKNF